VTLQTFGTYPKTWDGLLGLGRPDSLDIADDGFGNLIPCNGHNARYFWFGHWHEAK
jgi:hypothetical protein